VGKRTVEIAAAESVLQFNIGLKFHLQVLKDMGFIGGKYCVWWINEDNRMRLKKAGEAA